MKRGHIEKTPHNSLSTATVERNVETTEKEWGNYTFKSTCPDLNASGLGAKV